MIYDILVWEETERLQNQGKAFCSIDMMVATSRGVAVEERIMNGKK